MKLIYLKPALKCDSFDVAIGIKIPFVRVLVTIEPGRSLLQFVTTNCLNSEKVFSKMTSCIWLIEIVDRLARIKLSLFYLLLILAGLESID